MKIVDETGAEVLGENLEIIAEHIERLSKVGLAIQASRLSETAILTLLRHSTGLYQNQIKQVLDALPDLENRYLKKTKKTNI
jgi:hypothetical protein